MPLADKLTKEETKQQFAYELRPSQTEYLIQLRLRYLDALQRANELLENLSHAANFIHADMNVPIGYQLTGDMKAFVPEEPAAPSVPQVH